MKRISVEYVFPAKSAWTRNPIVFSGVNIGFPQRLLTMIHGEEMIFHSNLERATSFQFEQTNGAIPY